MFVKFTCWYDGRFSKMIINKDRVLGVAENEDGGSAIILGYDNNGDPYEINIKESVDYMYKQLID